jgi:cytosine/adenosine deaminase-related metal-dependent hydrolase
MTTPTAEVVSSPRQDGRWALGGVVGSQDDKGRPVSGRADLVVAGGIIQRLAPLGSRDHPGGPGFVLVPLFVNAHDHGRGTGTVAAGIPDGPLEEWIGTLRHQPPSNQEDLVGRGCDLMVASGVGASVICPNPQDDDTGAEVMAAADAVISRGVRAAIVYPIADTIRDIQGRSRDAAGWGASEVARHLAEVEDIAAKFEGPLIDVQLGPVGPQWVSEATLAAVGRHAEMTGRRVHMHLLESRRQREWADATYPEGIVALLDRVGLAGPRVCFAHGAQLRPHEMAALAERDCVLSLNASSNMRLCSGTAPVALARQAGVDVAAGLDGLGLADDADYWTELRLLRGLQQAQTGRTVDAETLITDLAAGGRRALGRAAPLAPAPGRPADFVLVDVAGYGHLLSALIGGERSWTAADAVLAIGRPERVAEVWVGGRCLYQRTAPGPSGEGANEPRS